MFRWARRLHDEYLFPRILLAHGNETTLRRRSGMPELHLSHVSFLGMGAKRDHRDIDLLHVAHILHVQHLHPLLHRWNFIWTGISLAHYQSALLYRGKRGNLEFTCASMSQCKNIGLSAYMIDWYRLPRRKALGLILIFAVANNSTKLTAGKLVELSLSSFCSVSSTCSFASWFVRLLYSCRIFSVTGVKIVAGVLELTPHSHHMKIRNQIVIVTFVTRTTLFEYGNFKISLTWKTLLNSSERIKHFQINSVISTWNIPLKNPRNPYAWTE